MEAMNDDDEERKSNKMRELMEQQNNTFKGNNAMEERVKDLLDEWIEAGEFLEGLE